MQGTHDKQRGVVNDESVLAVMISSFVYSAVSFSAAAISQWSYKAVADGKSRVDHFAGAVRRRNAAIADNYLSVV